MPFAYRDTCGLYYELSGDPAGPPLVLVRGLARSSRYWRPVLPHLAGFRILLVDNRGVGKSDATPPPYSSRQLADDIVAVMDAAGIARAHVFGISLGGMIAQHLAIAHGDRVDRLVIGCSTPGGRHAHHPALAARWAQLRQLRELQRAPDDDPARARGVLGQLVAALRHDAFDRLGEILHPTLIVTGVDDAIIPPANSRLLAERIPNAQLVVLPGARHDFTTDQPVESGRAVVEFLTR